MQKPQLIRNVAILGHLHHGKTILSDMLIKSTYEKINNPENVHKFTDHRHDEI